MAALLYVQVEGEEAVGGVRLQEQDLLQDVLQRAVQQGLINSIFWKDVAGWKLLDSRDEKAEVVASGKSSEPLLELPEFPSKSLLILTRRPVPPITTSSTLAAGGGPGPLSIGTPMYRFWDALRVAILTPAAGGAPAYIQLQPGIGTHSIQVFGEKLYGSIIVERPCYPGLFQLITANWKNPPNPQEPHALILGTPGIGKTMFLAYTMWCLLQMDANVCIVLELRGGDRFCFGPGAPVHSGHRTLNAFADRLAQDAVKYLIDSNEPQLMNLRANALEASSLRRQFYSQFQKAATSFSMPTWSFSELSSCHQLLRPSTSRTQLKLRFTIAGGSLRSMDASEADLKRDIAEALNRYDARALITTPGHAGKEEGVPDLLLHRIVDDDGTFKQHVYQFASSYVCEQVWKAYRVQLHHYFTEQIQASRPAGAALYFGVMAGRLFEDHAVRMLVAGGSFQSKCMQGRGKKKIMRLGPSELDMIVDEAADITQLISVAPARAGPSIGYPADPNFPAIDAMQIEGAEVRFYQMKNVRDESRRKIRADHLARLQGYWPAVTVIKLYQVVPDFRYDGLLGFIYVDAAGTSVARPANIEEWKLSIAISTFLSQ